jgi:hypothetical protein
MSSEPESIHCFTLTNSLDAFGAHELVINIFHFAYTRINYGRG